MNIISWLKKYEKLVYFNRCFLHRNNHKFRKLVLEGFQNPDYLKLESYGGDNWGSIIYAIRELGGNTGFFAELGVILIFLYFADERGFLPHVEWGKEFLYYEKDGVCGEKNAFLHYFEPVGEITNYSNSLHVLHSEYEHYQCVKKTFNAVSYDVSEEYVEAMALMAKKYIRYNEKTGRYLKDEYKKLIGEKRTIGIHYRGTDFNRKYNNHPVTVKIEQTIEEVKKLLATKQYEQVFLATDESSVVETFVETFGDIVKVYEDTFRSEEGDESVAFSKSDREKHHYMLGLEVLRDQYTLTNCDALVCGYSNITFMARVMRRAWHEEDFEKFVLINNGLWHNQNSFSNSIH